MPSNDKKIKWGILAPGRIAQSFAQDLLSINDAELHAVASRDLKKAEAFNQTYQGQVAYGDYQSLMKDPLVDAIYIATPHAFHKTYTLDCLEHGKAVLCEKPLGLNSAEVEEMLQKAKEKNVLLMEALWTYFLPHYQHLLDFLKKGSYGKVLSVEADFGFYRDFDPNGRLFDKKLGGGSLLDIGIYPIFAALSILGMPDEIKAKATFFKSGADSSCDMEFNYKNGAIAKLKSTLLKETPTTAVITCEKGSIKLNTQFHRPTSICFTDASGKEDTIDFGVTTKGYNYETMHFNELIRDGKTESPIMPHEFSRKLMQLMDEVKEIIGLRYY
ncbi:Gfo/Idh/MocA family oxidoreductase [Galbibacter sp. EGI 63066]|uniref:Gfo/Idh/MocA family protein n=1 Tax=Galbibacter sp. EGI 63066 TaxID=2993559 RepID=UPI0022494EC3|nr:Gfo/Idh/MocA family oxidoreductase [Galbibacter sp. EGI 63066]MCX2679327.1 Gfo/Idh/MocA family oxidoreductase [Galbibacter sp. EGI 63066]